MINERLRLYIECLNAFNERLRPCSCWKQKRLEAKNFMPTRGLEFSDACLRLEIG